MNPERARRIEDLYAKALEYGSEERAAFLLKACEGDEALLQEVESLIHEEDHIQSFMEVPAMEEASRQLASKTKSWNGRRLGHYELGATIGTGGMGQVYKATDTRLGRTVAVKILADHISHLPEARLRFEREAKTIASLNHPHICVLHDIGRDEGVDFLVMEYLEGITLAQRLKKGPLPLAEVLKIALEIGDALEKAHQKGVIHRDLKPANVMLTENGAKLLDFGVAKILRDATVSAPQTATPPDTDDLTGTGMIVGTPRYIAPEQLNNQEVDARTDIFAFGAVLYEMLTGEKAFQQNAEPLPPSQVVSGLSPQMDHVIARCLSKDPADRWHSIRDALLELRWAAEASKPASETTAVKQTQRRRSVIAVLAIVLAAVAMAAVYIGNHKSDIAVTDAQFEISVPEMAGPSNFAVSPDGRRIVYGVIDNSVNSLWVREINSLNARKLPGTDDARIPDWSADGRFVIFATRREVKKVDVTGGSAQTIAPLVGFEYRRSTSNQAGDVIFGNSTLRLVRAAGGPPEAITELDKSLGETYHAVPWFLPDGRHFLYQVSSTKPENRGVFIGSLDSKSKQRLMTLESKALYSPPGFLVFLQGKMLMARPFDASRLEFTGDAVPVADNVATDAEQRAFYVNGGTLLYRSREGATQQHWVWADRTGKTNLLDKAPPGAATVRLSPDGKRVAFIEGITNSNANVWTYDIERNVKTRVTTDSNAKRYPIWSPDGTRLMFASAQGAPRSWSLHEESSDGASPETSLFEAEPLTGVLPDDWSKDGRYVVFEKFKDGTQGVGSSARTATTASLWILPMFGDRKPFLYLETPFDKGQAVFSPNGRWLAYVSNESGSYQVFVQPFPNALGGKRQISTGGGMTPHWRSDGRELYYLDPTGKVMAVPVQADAHFSAGTPSALFTTTVSYPPYPTVLVYDVTPDGQHFLISTPFSARASSQIAVALNWPSLLKR